MRSVFQVVCLIALMGVPLAQAKSGPVAEFLGWSPNSRIFAYVTTRPRRNKMVTHGFLKQVKRSGRARFKRYNGSVRERAKRYQYLTQELTVVSKSKYQRVFALNEKEQLAITLHLGKRLGFKMTLVDMTSSRKPRELLSGTFEEIWTTFDARVFLSPNKRWVAIQMMMSTPSRNNHWFEGLRLSLR